MAGLASVAALAKLYHRRRHGATPDASGVEPDPAEELRRKLDEARAAGSTDDGPEPTTDASDEAASTATIEERRAAIHARAQEAIDAMKGDDA